MSLVRWQPDFFAISYTSKTIALGPEVCRPSDTRAENLVEAYHRKIQANHPILVALKNYIAAGWTIRIIVGALEVWFSEPDLCEPDLKQCILK